MALSLVGCGGDQFTQESFSPNTAGTSDVGDAGETTVGGADSPSSGGSDGKGGSSAGTDSGGSSGLGGTETGVGGDEPQAGTSGSGGTGTAGTGGSSMGGQPPVMVCNPKATQCADGDFQTCKNDGSGWTTQTCDFVCSASKGCIGSCTPGTKQCDGLKSQTCDENGQWVTSSTCSFICGGEGLCGGQCVPGTQQCSSTNAQTCNDKGYWATTEACQFSCNFSGGLASCGGACTNGTKQCSGKVPQTCTNNEWTSGTLCPFICSTGTCGGECAPGTQKCGVAGGIQTCSPQGTWLQEGAACPFTCSNGTCGGVCKPNTPCADDGNQCTDDVCNAQGTQCTHPPKNNGASCGSSSNAVCDAPDSCLSGTCQPNFKGANVICTDDANTCTTDMCNGSGACGHAAAPANTVCRAASCSNGTAVSQAVCGGVTSCPAATTTSCFGACNTQANACEAAPPNQIDTAAPLAIDNDASFVYASERSQGGVSQIVRYAKNNNAKTVLFESVNTSEYIYALIVAGNYVYFAETFWSNNPVADSGKVSRVSTTGGSVSTVSNDATFGFAKNSTDVYWSTARWQTCLCLNPGPVKVYSTPISPVGSVTEFSRTFHGVELATDIEVDDNNLYVWEMTPIANGQQYYGFYNLYLSRYNLANPLMDNATVHPGYFIDNNDVYNLLASLSDFPGLTKNGSTIYSNVGIAQGGGPLYSLGDQNLIFKYSGGSVTRLTKTSTAGLTSKFVADASNIYIDNQKISVNGGSMSYWTNHDLSALTLDTGFLYFGSGGYWNSLPYTGNVDAQILALLRAAKN